MAKHDIRKPRKKVNPLKAAKVDKVDYKDTALLEIGRASCRERVWTVV